MDTYDYSYTPLDVGFDLRKHDMTIDLAIDAQAVQYDDAGTTRIVRGSRQEIVAALEAAGYRVKE